MARRRHAEPSNLAFLDAMTCGLGAVILLYMILNASASRERDEAFVQRRAEATRLEREVLEGHEDLVELRNTLEQVEADVVEAHGLSLRTIAHVEEMQVELATFEEERLARREHLNRLQADLRSLEEDVRRLSAAQPTPEVPGDRTRSFVGDGDRQYLTGLKVGGERILILVDGSASMLADTLVNVIRFRNLPPEQARRAAKWRQAVRTVDWLLTQVPPESKVQVQLFAESAAPVLPSSGWIEASDARGLDEIVARLREHAPSGGTSLHEAFSAAGALSEAPDNIILVTDGLPTQGAGGPRRGTVSGAQRLKFFAKALEVLPAGVPVNTILLPMEGDPLAASSFWQLGMRTRGSCLMPTRDWP